MPRKTSPRTDNWAAALGAALKTRERLPSGDGWITSTRLREKWNVGPVKFYQTLRIMREAGKVEHFSGRVMVENKISRCDWYRLK